MNKFDFSGWATKNNVKCSDGRVIIKDAFKHNDGQRVPLVWNHSHNEPTNVLGHALLENREEGVYAYCTFNDTDNGQAVKRMVAHGDITSLSIYANQLKQRGAEVLHGSIREVSLVLAGANPEAFIDSIIKHADGEEEVVIYTGELGLELEHSQDSKKEEKKEEPEEKKEEPEEKKEEPKDESELEHKDDKKDSDDLTVEDVLNSMNDSQRKVLYMLIAQALEEEQKNNKKEEGEDDMKHNVFDKKDENVLQHSEEIAAAISEAKRYGSMKESFLQHGITEIDFLFPDAKTLTDVPGFYKRDTGWVDTVMSGVSRTPFARIKSVLANITGEEARARGYMKGKLKKEEVFTLLKRVITPTTVYKKQKLDRDDLVDITDFDTVSWLKGEMRIMLDEEIARAILISDGRPGSSEDKINELNIIPIAKDEDFYAIKKLITPAVDATPEDKAKTFIKEAVRARKEYKGSGQPKLFATEEFVTEALLLEDNTGRRLYANLSDLANAMMVTEIVTVPVMDQAKDANGNWIKGIIVNLKDYKVGADKGGQVNMFDDFDIDYNAMKYLIEARCSGGLVVPYSAIVLLEKGTAAAGE